ncbi:zinc finger HIT domain-containing protein 2 [Anabrus simplex]|uniref:zinc finger HIT domain-containing protein 2 n=1 Tax=Anabrus simplex TaxID=316456 RepID=UPI0035A2ACAE
MNQNQQICGICNTSPGKYVCPRCNVLYCSVPCYQSEAHLQCSESFYRENVLEELKAQDRDPEDSRKILQMLEKNYLEQEEEESIDSDDECDPDLATRLSGVNLDDADSVWENLTPAEQQAFEEMLRSGNVTNLIPKWEPWWMYRKEESLIEEIGKGTKEKKQNYQELCPPLKDVPCLSQISKCAPAPCVKYNVINVLAAYCYMMRYFNGEPHEYVTEAVEVLVTLSGCLRLNHNYESYELAVEDVAQEAVNCQWLDGSEVTLDLMRTDLQRLLTGPEDSNPSYYMQAALSDIYHLLMKAKQKKPTEMVPFKESKFSRRFGDPSASRAPPIPPGTIRQYMKKLEYFMSWAKSYLSMPS